MIGEWIKVAATSLKNVSATMGFQQCEIEGDSGAIPRGLGGAFVPLVGQSSSLQLGILSNPAGQEKLARVVLQLDADEEADHECITDALGELANCLVGQIKVAMRKVDPTLKIGLPVYIEGRVEDVGGAELRTLNAIMDGVSVSIVLVVAASS